MSRLFLNNLYITLAAYFLIIASESCAIASHPQFDKELSAVRDSLDLITMQIPIYGKHTYEKIISIRNQEQLDRLGRMLSDELKGGVNDIEIKIVGKNLILPVNIKSITDLNYPNANIKVDGSGAELVPEYIELNRQDSHSDWEGSFWTTEYDAYCFDDIVVDVRGQEISLMGEVDETLSLIELSNIGGKDAWRMKTDLPDLDEESCKDFMILVTRIWTSTKHKVIKVSGGWLYFQDDSNNLQEGRGPNVDHYLYGIYPRYQFVNCPASKGVHVKNGRIYIPHRYNLVRINKGGCLLKMSKCHFNSFEITGFNLSGLSKCPIEISHCDFEEGLFVHHNTYTNLSCLAFATSWCKNVCFSDNSITNARGRTIGYNATNFTICRNHFKNIGWMFNRSAVSGGGVNLHVCDNIVEDFNYSAISCGSYSATKDSLLLTFIIERNLIKLSNKYKKDYIRKTLADGGAIYICPSVTNGIIRDNVIQNIKGINGNRGIFLDDGAKNLAVYGNLVVNVENYYDIDLRLVNTYEKDIPDHNTNNSVFHNIMTGGYRFEDAGLESNCIGGQNVLLGVGPFQKYTIDISRRLNDIYLDSCSITRDYKVIIPKKYKDVIGEMSIGQFVSDYVVFQ